MQDGAGWNDGGDVTSPVPEGPPPRRPTRRHESDGPGPGETAVPLDHKFGLATQDHPIFRDEEGHLPISYDEDRVVLLARDPEWVFCYWEIRPDTAHRAMDALVDPVPVLRVSYRDLAGGEPRYYDERIDLFGRRHYLHVPESWHLYRVELGFRGSDGRFSGALVSNEVEAPAERTSAVVDDVFMTVPWRAALREPASGWPRVRLAPRDADSATSVSPGGPTRAGDASSDGPASGRPPRA